MNLPRFAIFVLAAATLANHGDWLLATIILVDALTEVGRRPSYGDCP